MVRSGGPGRCIPRGSMTTSGRSVPRAWARNRNVTAVPPPPGSPKIGARVPAPFNTTTVELRDRRGEVQRVAEPPYGARLDELRRIDVAEAGIGQHAGTARVLRASPGRRRRGRRRSRCHRARRCGEPRRDTTVGSRTRPAGPVPTASARAVRPRARAGRPSGVRSSGSASWRTRIAGMRCSGQLRAEALGDDFGAERVVVDLDVGNEQVLPDGIVMGSTAAAPMPSMVRNCLFHARLGATKTPWIFTSSSARPWWWYRPRRRRRRCRRSSTTTRRRRRSRSDAR